VLKINKKTKKKKQQHRLKVTDLVIIGSMYQMCIEVTTRAALDMNYTCAVVEDGLQLLYYSLTQQGETFTIYYMKVLTNLFYYTQNMN